ncbi:equilibrative nucleoside transporter 1-like [Oppia nitens]|uniref:equilibrative nucleoside transporter 1-like n=1 Tax=Oppia nitens TaxID=1686743 RepID=UPI0023DB93D2|nr:equilibrative nucleoside transporter 1-like [Oppia nitens]
MTSSITKTIPYDRYYIVFIILLLHGIGTLLPWNMLINANSYFVDYKLSVPKSSPTLDNFRTNFLSYLGIASKAPNILLQLINLFANTSHGSLSTRITVTLVIQALVFVFTIILAIIDTTEWAEIFFWLTMASAVVINVANGVYQGCVYGAAAKLPMKYTNAVSIGMNLSGTIASLFMIGSIAVSPSARVAAIIFFSCAVFILILCVISEVFIKNNTFYIYHTEKKIESEIFDNNAKDQTSDGLILVDDNQIEANNYINNSNKTNNKNNSNNNIKDTDDLKGLALYKHVLFKIWLQLLNIILIYYVSLSLFPALIADIKSMNNTLNEKYFSPVFCFLAFNMFATVGNFIAQRFQRPGPNYVIIFTLLRLLYIPFFLYCNYQPTNVNRSLPVVIKNDWIFIVGVVTMAMSSGYLSSLCMMYAPRCVQPGYASIAGMMAALTIILGILLGINFSLVYPLIV